MMLTCVQGPCIVVGEVHSDEYVCGPRRLMVEYKDGQFQFGNRCGDSLMELIANDAASEVFSDVYDPLIDSGQLCDKRLRSSQSQLFTLEQQLEILKIQYERNRPPEHPLLPPYDWLQLLAVEAENEFRFPAILRLYMLHISRQQAMSSSRSCLLLANSSGLFQMKFKDPGEGRNLFGLSEDEDFSKTSVNLILRGPLAGFVTLKVFGLTLTMTLFETLLDIIREDCHCPGVLELSESQKVIL